MYPAPDVLSDLQLLAAMAVIVAGYLIATAALIGVCVGARRLFKGSRGGSEG